MILPASPALSADPLPMGESAGAPDRIRLTSQYIERDGRPWIPVTGELHYSRIPRSRWKQTLGQAAAGGLNSVACYVFWRYHEPEPGGLPLDRKPRDLCSFIQLAAEAGLDVVVRLGPWAHGEARRGGFPDWLESTGCTPRTNDPAYLDLVERFYAQTISQLTGLTHAEGGPIIAAQIENELHDQPEHIARLRELAERLGLNVPLWTATGWGQARLPRTVLPVWSGYADGFWAEQHDEFPDFARPHFTYRHERDDHGVGADVRQITQTFSPTVRNEENDGAPSSPLPFATCELGGGMHVAYHRRPLVTPEDVAALALAKIGSGSTWQGYYMYSGGSHPPGHPDGEQESQATGYPNDMPQISYDFAAAIGEHGQIRPHHHLLRRHHVWLTSEAQRIAPMTAKIPGTDIALQSGTDADSLRWSVRDDSTQGYVFLSTYQPDVAPLQGHKGLQLHVPLGERTITVPRTPVDFPAGISTVWPLNYPLAADLSMVSATAEVLTRVVDGEGEMLILCALNQIPVEIVLDHRVEVSGSAQLQQSQEAHVVVLTDPPGPDCLLRIGGHRILVLDEAHANQLHRLPHQGQDRILLAEQPTWVEDGELMTESTVNRRTLIRDLVLAENGDRAPPPRTGGPQGRLSAPQDWSEASILDVPLPVECFAEDARSMLRLEFVADIARAVIPGAGSQADQLLSDHFWHGRDWEFELTPWRDGITARGLQIHFLPRRAADAVWIHPHHRDAPDGVHLHHVELLQRQAHRPSPASIRSLGTAPSPAGQSTEHHSSSAQEAP